MEKEESQNKENQNLNYYFTRTMDSTKINGFIQKQEKIKLNFIIKY